MALFTNKEVNKRLKSRVTKETYGKSEVIQKLIFFTSEIILLIFFTSENNFLKYARYFINIFLYFINWYIINVDMLKVIGRSKVLPTYAVLLIMDYFSM